MYSSSGGLIETFRLFITISTMGILVTWGWGGVLGKCGMTYGFIKRNTQNQAHFLLLRVWLVIVSGCDERHT